MRSSNPPVGTGRTSHCRNCPLRSNHQNTTGLLYVSESASSRGLGKFGTRGLRKEGVKGTGIAGFALDGEQQLMELAPDSPLSWAVFELAQGALETTECPIQSEFWMLFHFRRAPMHQ